MLASGKLQREADANGGALGFEFSGIVRPACPLKHSGHLSDSEIICAPQMCTY